MNGTILAAAACLLLASGAKAAPPLSSVIDEAYKICAGRAQADKPAMTECAMEAEGNWDKHIEETYSKLMDTLDPQGRNTLEQEQGGWLAHRSEAFDAMDAACANSTSRMECNAAAAASKMKFVRARAANLEKALKKASGVTTASFNWETDGSPAQTRGQYISCSGLGQSSCMSHRGCSWITRPGVGGYCIGTYCVGMNCR
ncbi:MAG: lysozyme inhibitor LprI family protein [Elusimicrobiales bacterium]